MVAQLVIWRCYAEFAGLQLWSSAWVQYQNYMEQLITWAGLVYVCAVGPLA